ncbi:GNAT family N-acetyltransferase [Streptomyces sp. ICBB 8177]|uniref:GNAT family N-acetyltransferase n=1 Tax=Streptomyces sp. ICBB 8177 TaxID=563922 RepID=UPI000D683EF4|nr:GNAT family N-acetyltransferase [Streptomyces sp. ICBB 8177]PWI44228.1 GNAT family N-acetyltransferase [Streptomyces sp. ICBB 8177]
MDRDHVLSLFDRQMRRGARPDDPTARVERAGDVVRQTGGPAAWNGVLWSDLTEQTADAAIAEQVRHFDALGRGFEWKLYSHDRPGDLAARLRAAGFVPEPAESLMVAAVADLSDRVELPEGVRLRTVTDAAGVDLVADVHEQVFRSGRSRLRQRLLSQLAAHPGTVSAVVATAGDVPVAAARLELHAGTEFAGLWGGGTLAAWRGRGIYRALVAHRVRLAAERGYRWLQVDASEASRPILERLGFERLATTTPYRHDVG